MAEDAAESGSRKAPKRSKSRSAHVTLTGFFIQSLFSSPSNHFRQIAHQ